MRVWPALLLAPLAAFFAISAGYALVPAACGGDWTWALHLAFLLPLVFSVAAGARAARSMKGRKDPFLPLVATWTAALFSLVIAAAWATTLIIAPCMP